MLASVCNVLNSWISTPVETQKQSCSRLGTDDNWLSKNIIF